MIKGNKSEKVIELAKRRGIFWPALEIYGGVSGFISLGEIGVKLKENIIKLWRDTFVQKHEFMEVETPLICPSIIFEASGHVQSFKDPMANCTKCQRKFRADHLLIEYGFDISEGTSKEEIENKLNIGQVKCKECGNNKWEVNYFLTMFGTSIGPYSENIGYMRPETAQGIFTEFKRLHSISRGKMPIGIAQIGKAFRNEISPRQGVIRLREFSMMEVELFFDPLNPGCPYLEEVKEEKLRLISEKMAEKGEKSPIIVTVEESLKTNLIKQEWLAYFMALSMRFLKKLGISENNQRFYAKPVGERAHYSEQTFDHEILLDKLGWVEVAGHAYRTDFDLRSHMDKSSVDLSVTIPLKEPIKEKHLKINVNPKMLHIEFPNKVNDIIKKINLMQSEDIKNELETKGELTIEGCKLTSDFFEFKELEEEIKVRHLIPQVVEPSFGIDRLIYATIEYAYEEKEKQRVILKIPSYLAPIQVAIFPLLSKENLQNKSLLLYEECRKIGINAIYDDSGSIGRRYARADEIGVPYSITIDHQSLNDDTITIRDRDTWEQTRISIKEAPEYLSNLFILPDNCEKNYT